MARPYRLAAIALVVALSGGLSFAETIIHSGVTRSNLIELYTSEGCSSCPPADRWLSTLRDHPGLWDDLIPIAFHVDYWDYIGWKDRFARSEYSDRQRQYSREGSVPTVYTPALVSNGAEWRNFSWKPPIGAGNHKVGSLIVDESRGTLEVRYEPEAQLVHDKLSMHIALLGFGLRSAVRAGENAGRELIHDFVVLEYLQGPLHLSDGSYRGTSRWPESNVGAERYALAVWVSPETEQMPIQSAGTWLD